jgi:hypothetical protein
MRGVRFPGPKEREPIFKSIFIDAFEMVESSHKYTFIIFLRKFVMGSGFLGTANPLGFLPPHVPKSRLRVPGNGNPNLTPLNNTHRDTFIFRFYKVLSNANRK